MTSPGDALTRTVDLSPPDLLQDLFQGLNRAGVGWCLLRPLPTPEAASGDIDLLVQPGAIEVACAAGRAAGFTPVPGHSHGRNLLRYAPTLPGWHWVHLVDELSFGPFYRLQTGAEAACLARGGSADGIRRLNPADEFWVTLLHCLLDKGVVKPHHRDRLRALAATADDSGPLGSLVVSVSPAGWTPERMIQAVSRGAWGELEQMAPSLLETWSRQGPIRPPAGLLRRIKGGIGYRLRAWHRRGISVALLGPDGAGKTTLATEIEREFVFPVRRLYMGLTGGALRRVHRIRIPGVVLAGTLAVLWWRYAYALYLRSQGNRGLRPVHLRRGRADPVSPVMASANLAVAGGARVSGAGSGPGAERSRDGDVPAQAGLHGGDPGRLATELPYAPPQGAGPRGRYDATARRRRPDVIEQIWRRYAARWR